MSQLTEVNEKIRTCLSCPLGRPEGRQPDGTLSRHVPGEGPESAEIMVVGEAPGAEEERTGLPFVGRSGRLLTEILTAAGLERSRLFITSVCKCRPPENRNPLKAEISACFPWLEAQLDALRPRMVLTVGNVPTQTLLGVKAGIKSLRGSLYDFQPGGRKMTLCPLFHPAYLLRNPRRTPGSPWDLMLHDLMNVKKFMGW